MNDPTSPYFEKDFNQTEMVVMGTFDKLNAKLHIESFLNLYEFGKYSRTPIYRPPIYRTPDIPGG